MNKHIIIGNFISDAEVEEIKRFSKRYHEQDSKIGYTIQSDKKRRKDIFYGGGDIQRLDNIIFKNAKPIIKSVFDRDIKYREVYKKIVSQVELSHATSSGPMKVSATFNYIYWKDVT